MLHRRRRRRDRAHDPLSEQPNMPPLSLELKLLEHTPLSEYKYVVLYRIGSVALLSAEVTRARSGKGWCVCNVILTSPQVINGWTLRMQKGWERGITHALRIDPDRYSLIFHWHRTTLMVNEESRQLLEAILTEQCASVVQ
jgi:hypothetical protein